MAEKQTKAPRPESQLARVRRLSRRTVPVWRKGTGDAKCLELLQWFYSEAGGMSGERGTMHDGDGRGCVGDVGPTELQRAAATLQERVAAVIRDNLTESQCKVLAGCYPDSGYMVGADWGSAPAAARASAEKVDRIHGIKPTDGEAALVSRRANWAHANFAEAWNAYLAQVRSGLDEHKTRRSAARTSLLASLRALAAPATAEVRRVTGAVRALLAPILGKREGCRDDADE